MFHFIVQILLLSFSFKGYAEILNEAILQNESDIGPPTNVTVISLSSTDLAVSWLASEGDEGNLIYSVTWTPSDGSVEYSPDANVAFLHDLEPCTNYSIIVTATDGTDESPSDEASGRTRAGTLPLVENFRSSTQNFTSITLNWDAPDTNCEITRYYIYYSGFNPEHVESPSNDDFGSDYVNGTQNELLVDELMINGFYNFDIFAYSMGYISDSATLNVSTKTIPDTVRDLILVPDSHWIHASWELENPSGMVDGFTIYYYEYSQNLEKCTTDKDTFSTEESEDCTSLAESVLLAQCCEYRVRVDTIGGATLEGYGDQEVMTLPDYAMNLNMSCTSDYDINFNYDLVIVKLHYSYLGDCWSPEVSYEAESKFGSQTDTGTCYTEYEGCSVYDALPYAQYTFTFAANTTDGYREEQCTCISAEIAPSEPQNLTSTAGKTTADLVWSQPEELNGIIQGYQISWECEVSDWGDRKYDATSNDTLHYTIKDLPYSADCTAYVQGKTVRFGSSASTTFRTESDDNTADWVIGVSVTIAVLVLVGIILFVQRDRVVKIFTKNNSTEYN